MYFYVISLSISSYHTKISLVKSKTSFLSRWILQNVNKFSMLLVNNKHYFGIICKQVVYINTGSSGNVHFEFMFSVKIGDLQAKVNKKSTIGL